MTGDDRRQAPLLPVVLFRQCPRCGHGALFERYLKLRKACAECGLDYSAFDSGDGPAVFVIFLVGPIAALFAFWFQWTIAPSIWLFMGVLCAVILGLSLALLPVLKAAVVALQYRNKAGEGRSE